MFLLLLLMTLTGQSTPISNPRYVGATPRLTTTLTGQPVLTWVEKESDKHASFYAAISTDNGQTFGPKRRIVVPTNIAVHAEGMPKLAVKGVGTWFALVEVPRPTSDQPRASDLLYVQSNDNGQTWTAPQPIHRDLTPGKGHSFADVSRLPNGELGVVWLDEKLPGREGRCVKFVQTKPNGGFTNELVVDDNACQCCRTNVFIDDRQHIHLTYRDLAPGGKPGEIGSRDISHVMSTDNGQTFSQPQTVLADEWRVNACPHTGPVVAQAGRDLFVTWFSGREGATGLRLAKLGETQPVARVLSLRARHPQVVALDGRVAWLWDESMLKPGQAADEPMPTYITKIALRTRPDGPTTYLTSDDVSATYPVALATSAGLLVVWEEKRDNVPSVVMTRFITPF